MLARKNIFELNVENKLNLPPLCLATYVNEIDRYGFSSYLRERLSIHLKVRAFCNWMNGWYWWDDINVNDFGYNKEDRKKITIVHIFYIGRLFHSGILCMLMPGIPLNKSFESKMYRSCPWKFTSEVMYL